MVFFRRQWNATEEGGFSFECQHGPLECEGNLFQVKRSKVQETYSPPKKLFHSLHSFPPSPSLRQACLLDRLKGEEDATRVKAVTCIMGQEERHLNGDKVGRLGTKKITQCTYALFHHAVSERLGSGWPPS